MIPEQEASGLKWKRIAPEQLADYAGDRIFLAVPFAGPDASEAQRQWTLRSGVIFRR